MRDLKELCIKLTQEDVNNLESKHYANGQEKKVNDFLLYVMLTENINNREESLHLLPINYESLNSEYKFTGKYFDEISNNEFKFPIVEGKYIQPKVTDLKEFNNYIKNFPTKIDKLIKSLEKVGFSAYVNKLNNMFLWEKDNILNQTDIVNITNKIKDNDGLYNCAIWLYSIYDGKKNNLLTPNGLSNDENIDIMKNLIISSIETDKPIENEKKM